MKYIRPKSSEELNSKERIQSKSSEMLDHIDEYVKRTREVAFLTV